MSSERLLQATHPEPKFWGVRIDGSTLIIRTGPLHTPGTTREIPCKSPEAAAKTAQQLIDQRLKDGFREASAVAASSGAAAELEPATEAKLVAGDLDAWSVFADSLLETSEKVRGELISLQVRAARKERGAIGKSKAFIKEHFDALVGAPLAAWNKQVTIDWKFGYARTIRVWSGPHNAPIGDVLETVLLSPASRFLKQLEFGSPGNEGRYDMALRVLAKASWPKLLDSLYLGNFDVEAARAAQSAWPRLESLTSLTPVADRLRSLEVRAAINTFGKKLEFPKLKRLVLIPNALDARLVTDLLSLEAPLEEFGLGCEFAPKTGWEGWARFVRERQALSGLHTLTLAGQNDAVGLLEALGDSVSKLERVDLNGALRVDDSDRLIAMKARLKNVTLAMADAPGTVKRLGAGWLLDTEETEFRAPKSSRRPAARPRRAAAEYDDDRYDEVTE
ncbi:MAG: WGR domain-containing protein [Archangium sp.]|nr:WGR domain-containing protein [Archangium sp.]